MTNDKHNDSLQEDVDVFEKSHITISVARHAEGFKHHRGDEVYSKPPRVALILMTDGGEMDGNERRDNVQQSFPHRHLGLSGICNV